MADLDHNRPALGIRQPWAELILRGIKTLEIRSTSTRIRGPIYIYASRRPSTLPAAQTAIKKHRLQLDELPTGLLVGSVELVDSTPARGRDAPAACVPREYLNRRHAWHLANPRRFKQPVEVRYLPYGVWFYPFRRKT